MYNERMTDLLLNRPNNLHIPPDMRVWVVDSDMYNICQRIAEEVPKGDRLYINALQEGDKIAYAIMEHADNNTDMLVMKVGPGYEIDALDARVLTKLRYLLSKPLPQRVREFELAQEREEQKQHQDKLDEIYEKIGGQMRHDLMKNGFTDSIGVSLPLNNRAARRARRAHSSS